MEFYQQSKEGVLKGLRVDPERGLSSLEIGRRRIEYGWNELKAKKGVNPFLLFLRQFKSFIIYILIFAVILSFIAREYVDAFVILAILIFNALLGFFQEYKAEKAIESLKKLAGLRAKVIRNGGIILIDSKELVPGDILLLEEGSRVPADARILEAIALGVSEAALTGESMPVSKHADSLENEIGLADQRNMLFSGTIIARGRGKAVVVETGMKSEIGKIAGMIAEIEEEQTPLQKKLESLGKRIGAATLVICFLIFLLGALKDDLFQVLLSEGFLAFIFASKTWFLTAVSLAVAAVPEGLPAIVTIVLALGVVRMAKRNALIRRLPSVETLGETTVICSDKTGTLTKGEMTVRVAYTNFKQIEIGGDGYTLQGEVKGEHGLKNEDLLLFKIGVLCNNASLVMKGRNLEISGDPTEAALLVSAEKAGIRHLMLRKSSPRIQEEPFDSTRKMMSTVHEDARGRKYVFTKGAPENLLEKCDRILVDGRIMRLTPPLKKRVLDQNTAYAQKALRMLGFAYKEYKENEFLEEHLVFVGLQGMIDPPHPEVKDSIVRCKEAGIRVIMVTGDHRNTAEAIAREIGIEGESIEGLEFSKLSGEKQIEVIERVNIFSRVEPRHKMIIVDLLQKKGEVVAMTGDGVNDAPAIKKADLGIAMGLTGTDVTKETSDMILQDDNFTSIVNAVEEGRGVYDNIKKFVNYLLSCNLGEILIIFFAILLGWPLPLTAVMLLWLNLVTDGLPALALGVDPYAKDLMKRPPRRAKEGILDRGMMFNILFVSILITLGVLGLFFWAMQNYGEESTVKIQTIALTSLIVMELARLQAIRSEYKIGAFSNKYLLLAVASSLALQLLIVYTPLSRFFGTTALSLLDWGWILGAGIIVFMVNLLGLRVKNKLETKE